MCRLIARTRGATWRSRRLLDDIEQRIREAQEKFNAGMGADGDATPYPLLRELRNKAAVHPGWPEMGVPEDGPDGKKTFTAYSFDAVKAVFTDNITFSTRIYEDMVRPLQGPTILEMQEPEHATYRRLHEFAFARSSMKRWDTELVGPLVDRTMAKFRDNKRADLVEAVFMPIPVRIIAALLGLPESDIGEFHRLAIDLLGFRADMETAMKASAEMKEYFIGVLADRRKCAERRHGDHPVAGRDRRHQDVGRANLRVHAQSAARRG